MIEFENFAVAYQHLLNDLIKTGNEVDAIRGRKTKELLNYSFCLKNPSKNLAYIDGRKFNIMHAINESVCLFTKDDSVELASLFNDRMREFSDDGKTLYGNYGKRIGKGLNEIIEKLNKDKNLRSAVLNIYSTKDGLVKTKDIPCTETIQFLVRDGKLNMIVNMRSNDCIWGTPYDVFMFTNMQMVVANTLELEVGKYYHNAGSMHLYDDMYEIAENILNSKPISIEYKNGNKMSDMYLLSLALYLFAHDKSKGNYVFLSKCVESMRDRTFGCMIMKELEYKYKLEKDDNLQFEVSNYVMPYYFCKRWFK